MREPTLHPDFKEFLCSLSEQRVRFIIVGAHALAVHGKPRATADIDILVEPTQANARRLAAALSAFGFPEHAAAATAHFSKPERMATLGHEPVRIDVLSSITGVTFREAWRGRFTAKLDGLELPFLGLAELRRAKQAAGRPKDLLDLALLDELSPAPTFRPATAKRKAPRKTTRRPRK